MRRLCLRVVDSNLTIGTVSRARLTTAFRITFRARFMCGPRRVFASQFNPFQVRTRA